MSDYQARGLVALDQIEDLLDAYADARFAPSGPVLARMRAHVLAQATELAAAGARRQSQRKPARWSMATLHVQRRAAALGMAATFSIATTAAVLAAPPGSPFFNARLAIETAFLPNQADARLVSHEQHLQAWVAEAEAAAERGDAVALDAALAAYDAELDASVADLGDDPDRLAHLEATLGKHVAVLTALAVRLPEQAAIEHALDMSQKAAAKLKDKSNQQADKPSHDPHPTPQPHQTKEPNTKGGGGGNGGGNGGGGPDDRGNSGN